jgi:hypothetical protein
VLARRLAVGATLQNPTPMDEIVDIVTDVEGYIDAPLHARFREVAAAGGHDAEAEVRRYAAAYGDLTLRGRHWQALWEAAMRSFQAKQVVWVPALEQANKDIAESEKKTGRTRLSDVMEATGRVLKAASQGSWTVLDGRNYVFTEIDIINQLGAVAAQAHRIEALFNPTFDPPKRRWLSLGAPVAIDSEVAISYQPDPDRTWQFNYRARLDEETYLEAVVNLADTGVKLDGSQFDELMKDDAFLAKGVVVGVPDRGAFRGTPSNRYLLKGDNLAYSYRAARQWLIPERRLDIYLATYTKVAPDGANAWLDRMERALVVV